MAVSIEPCTDPAWRGCLRLANDALELRILVSEGPRILFLGSRHGQNLLYRAPPSAPAGPGGFVLHGGHRLWTAPEDLSLTYICDDAPVETERMEDGLVLRSPPEKATGLAKVLTVRLAGTSVRVQHKLVQVKGESHRAPWAITAFAAGGRAWLPRVAHRPQPLALVPDQSLVLWPYTDLQDPRLTLGGGAVVVDHDASRGPLKVGAAHPPGWLAWSRERTVVVQHTATGPGPHPDLGASHEIYTDGNLTELEALGRVAHLRPGDTTTLDQTWWVGEADPPVGAAALADLVSRLGLDPGQLGAAAEGRLR